MEDDAWEIARARASAAERKPGMTPERRSIARLFVAPLTVVIRAKIGDTSHLPHGRLGKLLQTAEPRSLALIALEAIVPQLWRPRRRKADYEVVRDIKLAVGKTFYANVTMAKAAKEARGDKAARRTLRWRQLALMGKFKAQRHETPEAWLDRLRRTRFAIWQALTEEVSRPEFLRAGSWLLQCAEEADLVRFLGNDLVPVDKWADDLRRVWNVVLRSNVRLLPTKGEPEPWTKPEIFRNGLKTRFVSHWNRDHQKSIAASFESPAFQNRHLKAANRLGKVALRVDDWTLRLVDALDADPSGGIKVAAMVARRGTFYNSYHIDTRGRFYADQGFNYATADTTRSLFRFAHGAEIGNDGLYWLRIHAANCYGLDKLPYEARAAWVAEHEGDIARTFSAPLETTDFWRSADKPFAFAAACRELVLADNNPKFITTLPIAFDHTASGIQHLALIGLDEKTAPIVNLQACDKPRDIYDELTNHTIELFDPHQHAAIFWQRVFSEISHAQRRKLLKVLGVSFAYGSTEPGNRQQIYAGLYDIFENICRCPACYDYRTVDYLVRGFRQACADVLPGPVQIMGYVQSLVRECNKAKRVLEWTSPSGLRVSNLYPKLDKPEIYLPDGTCNILAVGVIPNTTRASKAVSSVAANYVHSMDAAHLVRTVNALADNEMDSLCVHDSYAILACHAAQFHITNREELALMYNEMFERGGPLALLREQNDNIGDPPPPVGKFDIWKVQDATYACT